jgi:hypothetical protein
MARTCCSRRIPKRIYPKSFEDLSDWLSPAQVASYLGLGRDATYKLFHKYKARRFGGLLRLSKHVFDPRRIR